MFGCRGAMAASRPCLMEKGGMKVIHPPSTKGTVAPSAAAMKMPIRRWRSRISSPLASVTDNCVYPPLSLARPGEPASSSVGEGITWFGSFHHHSLFAILHFKPDRRDFAASEGERPGPAGFFQRFQLDCFIHAYFGCVFEWKRRLQIGGYRALSHVPGAQNERLSILALAASGDLHTVPRESI